MKRHIKVGRDGLRTPFRKLVFPGFNKFWIKEDLYVGINRYINNGNTNLVWSNQVCVNDGGSKLAYISDKENLLTYSVFMYDMETEEEILVCSDPDYNYLMIGWISDDTILCYKLKGEGLTVVAIDATGNEQVISLETIISFLMV